MAITVEELMEDNIKQMEALAVGSDPALQKTADLKGFAGTIGSTLDTSAEHTHGIFEEAASRFGEILAAMEAVRRRCALFHGRTRDKGE